MRHRHTRLPVVEMRRLRRTAVDRAGRPSHRPLACHGTAHEDRGCFDVDQRLSGCTRNIPVCLPSHWSGVFTKPFLFFCRCTAAAGEAQRT
jgi:hypothetical protein